MKVFTAIDLSGAAIPLRKLVGGRATLSCTRSALQKARRGRRGCETDKQTR